MHRRSFLKNGTFAGTGIPAIIGSVNIKQGSAEPKLDDETGSHQSLFRKEGRVLMCV